MIGLMNPADDSDLEKADNSNLELHFTLPLTTLSIRLNIEYVSKKIGSKFIGGGLR